MWRGACLCGAVSFRIEADLADAIGCHCAQCRKHSGHYFSAVAAPKVALAFQNDAALRWYRHTDKAQRGFCGTCGSSLFWRSDTGETVMVAMGALEQPTGLGLAGHYWTDCKGDYYDLCDGVPQHEGNG